ARRGVEASGRWVRGPGQSRPSFARRRAEGRTQKSRRLGAQRGGRAPRPYLQSRARHPPLDAGRKRVRRRRVGPRAEPTVNEKTAVLLLAYGAAASLDDIPAYLQDIRGGRPATPELIATVRDRYVKIGGKSPLLDITRAQAAALAAKTGLKVYVGMRHSPPTILDAVRSIAREGNKRIVAMPLTPFYSKLSVG